MLGSVLVPRRLCPIAGPEIAILLHRLIGPVAPTANRGMYPEPFTVKQISVSLAELRTIADPCHSPSISCSVDSP